MQPLEGTVPRIKHKYKDGEYVVFSSQGGVYLRQESTPFQEQSDAQSFKDQFENHSNFENRTLLILQVTI